MSNEWWDLDGDVPEQDPPGGSTPDQPTAELPPLAPAYPPQPIPGAPQTTSDGTPATPAPASPSAHFPAKSSSVGPATAPQPAPHPAEIAPPPRQRSRRSAPLLAGLALGVLLAVVVAAVVVTLTGGDDDPDTLALAERTAESEPTTSFEDVDDTAPTSTEAPTTTEPPPTTTEAGPDRAAMEESVLRIQNILGQSSEGRAEIVDIVDRVQRCAVSLLEAERRIESVIENRNSVLQQISSLQVEAAPELNSSVDALQRSLQHSLEANRAFQEWFRWLDDTYSSVYFQDSCWSEGTAPLNAAHDRAVAASGNATRAKQEFTGVFNPIATEFDTRTWEYSQF